jgi:hypothetical protein
MTGFVPGFDNDIFISYAHNDGAGWSQTFEETLGAMLPGHLGVKVSIWQDEKRLRVGQNWQAEIETGIQKSAIFIAVLSPIYKNSEWCKRERDIFRQLFSSQEEFEKSGRFFKVVKTRWENDGHRSFWPKLQHIEFFRPTDGPAHALEFKPGSANFGATIKILANSLIPVLRRLRCERERVFVASPAEDCKRVWDELRDNLKDNGYDVQPEGPRDEGFSEDFVRSEIEHALLSVHLLGTVHDPFAQTQIQLAADLERRLMFWFAPGRPDANQTQLIKNLRAGRRPDRPDLTLPPGWEALGHLTPRRFIEEVLAALAPKPPQPPRPDGAPRIYIVHDAKTEEDAHIALTLQKKIGAREHIKVLLSPPDERQHLDLLQTCEGVLLCRKSAPEAWLDHMAPKVLLAERLFPQAPLKSRAFLVSNPARWRAWPNLKVFPYTPEFQLEDLEPFLAPLRAEGSVALGR